MIRLILFRPHIVFAFLLVYLSSVSQFFSTVYYSGRDTINGETYTGFAQILSNHDFSIEKSQLFSADYQYVCDIPKEAVKCVKIVHPLFQQHCRIPTGVCNFAKSDYFMYALIKGSEVVLFPDKLRYL